MILPAMMTYKQGSLDGGKDDMLNIKLISEVEKRPCLWECDFKHNGSDGDLIVTQAWEEVAHALNLQSSAVKDRWIELHQNLIYKLKNGGKRDEKFFHELFSWRYFEPMKFLSKTIEDGLFDDDTVIESEETNKSVDNIDEDSNSSIFILDTNIKTELINDEVIQIEEHASNSPSPAPMETVEDIQCERNDYLFLKSLLPLLKRLPVKRKMKIRMKIHEMLLEEMQIS